MTLDRVEFSTDDYIRALDLDTLRICLNARNGRPLQKLVLRCCLNLTAVCVDRLREDLVNVEVDWDGVVNSSYEDSDASDSSSDY
jgi:hypothetical protein